MVMERGWDLLALLWDPSLTNKLGSVGSELNQIDTKPSVRNYIATSLTDSPGSVKPTPDGFSYLDIIQWLPSLSARPAVTDTNSTTANAIGYTFDLNEMEPPLDETHPQPIQPTEDTEDNRIHDGDSLTDSLEQSSVNLVGTTATDPTTTTGLTTTPSGHAITEDQNMLPSPPQIPSPPTVHRQYTTDKVTAVQ
jgi:hypothetical protein